jgi:hypothetical protein
MFFCLRLLDHATSISPTPVTFDYLAPLRSSSPSLPSQVSLSTSSSFKLFDTPKRTATIPLLPSLSFRHIIHSSLQDHRYKEKKALTIQAFLPHSALPLCSCGSRCLLLFMYISDNWIGVCHCVRACARV